MLQLAVRDGAIAQTVRVEAGKAFIGRAPTNTISIDDPLASRRHCMLRVSEGGVELLDLNSLHGLTVNGQRQHRATLTIGDVVQIGAATLTVEEISGAPAVEPTLAGFGGYLDDDDALAYVLRATESDLPRPPSDPPPVPPAEVGPERISVRARPHRAFADELYTLLRRMPGWIASVVFHLLILLVIWEIEFVSVARDENVAIRQRPLDGALDRIDDAPEQDPSETDPFAAESVDPLDPELRETAPRADEGASPPSDPFDRLPTPIGAGDRLLSTRTLGKRSKAVDIGENSTFGKGDAKDANARTAQHVKRALDGQGGRDARLLRRFPKGEIKVIEGQYDRVEEVLDLYDILHTRIAERELHRLRLDDTSVLFVNCSNAQLPPKVVEAIAAWVKSGGYLFTTDWALEHVIERAFPDTIKSLRTRNDRVKQTENETVAVKVRHPHFLLEGAGLERGDALWWLEDSSYPFRIVRSSLVESIVQSDDLKRRHGSEHVAVTFRWGAGRVVHVIGHYYQKEGNMRGTFAMHRIVTNFLVSAVKRQ